MIHSAFIPPDVSWRRKRSAKTVIRSQNQMIQAKITISVHITLRNGYELASKRASLVFQSSSFRTQRLNAFGFGRRRHHPDGMTRSAELEQLLDHPVEVAC